jgi:ribonuclease HI
LNEHLSQLLDEIGQLTPMQRRRLFRQAQLMGLLDREDLLTDRDALQIVPAVQKRTAPTAAKPTATKATAPADDDAPYRSPVSGRVVVGAPQHEGETPASVMRPLPGQAPEQPIRIVFDGGSKGNPGQGYGSYALEWPAYPRQVVRLQFGNRVTNNEAEYDTLISALEAVIKRLTETGADARSAKLEIWGDSQLVINQVNGEWEANKAEMRVRRDKARALLNRFGTSSLRYHSRNNNVEILGH